MVLYISPLSVRSWYCTLRDVGRRRTSIRKMITGSWSVGSGVKKVRHNTLSLPCVRSLYITMKGIVPYNTSPCFTPHASNRATKHPPKKGQSAGICICSEIITKLPCPVANANLHTPCRKITNAATSCTYAMCPCILRLACSQRSRTPSKNSRYVVRLSVQDAGRPHILPSFSSNSRMYLTNVFLCV